MLTFATSTCYLPRARSLNFSASIWRDRVLSQALVLYSWRGSQVTVHMALLYYACDDFVVMSQSSQS